VGWRGEESPLVETQHDDQLELDAAQLAAHSSTFAAPRWLRDLGLSSWFLVGFAALLAIVTIGAGALFGMAGMVLAAPLTSAAVHIGGRLSRARAAPSTAPT
jgi:hypothetical protein